MKISIHSLLPLALLLVGAVSLPQTVQAQESTTVNIKISDPVFTDGIYFSAAEFNKKKPSVDVPQIQFGAVKHKSIKNWFKGDSLFYSTSVKEKNYLPFDKIWGYYENNTLFVQRNGFAHKVHALGQLSLYNESYPAIKAPFNPVAVDEAKNVTLKMLDLQSGKTMDYTLKNFTGYLKQNDPELLKEYLSVGNSKVRRQLMIKYIEKYNSRHPLN